MEIEHKYLVVDESFRAQATKVYHIEQGYLATRPTVRVRIRDEEAFLTIKGASDSSGLMRDEWEYEIPVAEARELMKLCSGRTLVKDRYLVPYAGHTWEVDVFLGRHEGLTLAELEVERADETYELPPWAGLEVTGDRRYYNATMALSQSNL